MPSSPVTVPKMSVYYPYIHIRDERWLKVAALYWPRMVRIVSPDYPTRNSQLVEILRDELGFILDNPPDAAARHAAEPFAAFIDGFGPTARKAPEGRARERVARPRAPCRATSAGRLRRRRRHRGRDLRARLRELPSAMVGATALARMPQACIRVKSPPSLAGKLIGLRLAVPARGEWLAMNPELAWLYKCRLTEELARRNNLVPATDQMPAHAVMDGPRRRRLPAGPGRTSRSSPLTSRRDSGSSASMPSSPGTWIRYRQPRSSRSGAGSPRSSTDGGSTPMRWPRRWKLSCKPSNRPRSCRRTWTMP